MVPGVLVDITDAEDGERVWEHGCNPIHQRKLAIRHEDKFPLGGTLVVMKTYSERINYRSVFR
ncbi:hypothetical protein PsorP6_006542 [Peronosclerospora sorghi]|uniref:Uncharacterized protein n=1 Tax=Peronosclerospora sorghi TaxID=230839 RepID=A0ACC0W5P8_9STRA|nr:hypothetical protein PsorP6_006542 [Peronosclerospora sorghi]